MFSFGGNDLEKGERFGINPSTYDRHTSTRTRTMFVSLLIEVTHANDDFAIILLCHKIHMSNQDIFCPISQQEC